MMTKQLLQDKCRGSLVGGAVGDALGYAVEFNSLNEIRRKYGPCGIMDYSIDRNGVAEFSDDTQMSLFTAAGLLGALADGKNSVEEMLPYITVAYKHWYMTQTREAMKIDEDWLLHVRALWSRRAPGNTCMSSLQVICKADGASVVNNSKGCGGVMRVAPIGIFSAAHPDLFDMQHAGVLAGYTAEITHKHPYSTYSSMALAMIVAECLACDAINCEKFHAIVFDRVFDALRLRFGDDAHFQKLQELIQKSMNIALSRHSNTDAIHILGEGWVAEETLAIAVFSVMRYIDDFEKCICCAVNHSGDSDSTGAVAGNIIGAILGYDAIPAKFKTGLELHDLLLSIADDLAGVSSEQQMKERYLNHKPYNVDPSKLL